MASCLRVAGSRVPWPGLVKTPGMRMSFVDDLGCPLISKASLNMSGISIARVGMIFSSAADGPNNFKGIDDECECERVIVGELVGDGQVVVELAGELNACNGDVLLLGVLIGAGGITLPLFSEGV